MVALVYAPKCTIRIYSTKLNATIDVTEDIESWTVTRLLGPGVSTASWSLLNQGQKYAGIFSPMDRVVVYLRRIRTVMAFSGYLDEVPVWAAVPNSVRFSASCTLKILQNFYWDPGSAAASALYSSDSSHSANSGKNDGGLANRTISLLSEVVGWDKSRIHIGAIPRTWFDKIAPLMEEAVSDAEAQAMSFEVGSAPYLAGESATTNTYATIPGIGKGTGSLPATSGKISHFGGPGGGAYGNMALTGESGVKPNDDWYAAMRWPYKTDSLQDIPGVDVVAAKAWWANRRILVVSPKTGKSVILRAADWGPNISTGRVLDVSPAAMSALGVTTDDVVTIAFPEQQGKSAKLGPVKQRAQGSQGGGPDPVAGTSSPGGTGGEGPIGVAVPVQINYPPGYVNPNTNKRGKVVASSSGRNLAAASGLAPSSQKFTYGAPGDASNMVTITAGGVSFTVHRLAADKFRGFVNDLVSQLGYHPKAIGGYYPRKISGTTTWSNHAYGLAIDIDPSINPYYSSPSGGKYALPGPPAIISLARKHGLGWGGEWRTKKDYMHFEVIGGPSSSTYGGVSASVSGTSGGASTAPVQKWQTPVAQPYTVTARFGDKGPNWTVMHSGTDFSTGGEGRPIRPVGPGVVHSIGLSTSYGNEITIDHGKGVYTQYAHMQAASPLSVGAKVSNSSTLGKVGSTGNVTGAHVHVELRLDADTYNAALKSGGIEKYVLGNSPPPRGVTGGLVDVDAVTGGGGGAGSAGDLGRDNIAAGLLNVYQWAERPADLVSMALVGKRALMNDEPIQDTVNQYMGAGFRDFCSAPNGDFIAWFPDYYGHHQMAGKMIISPLEIDLQGGAPEIRWTDINLKTHHFAIGSLTGLINNTSDLEMAYTTAGIATVEDPRLVAALFAVSQEEAEAISETMSKRYGARPQTSNLATIPGFGTKQEFYFACRQFMRNWSEQWRTSINVTFMPELFPGMLACFPTYGIQGYVVSVTHSGDNNSGGYKTQVNCAPWSTIGNEGPGALPKGAPL